MRFADRTEAGRRLAADVAALRLDHPIVLALPRGGVPVGFEVAQRISAPLDVVVVRKIGAPMQPELAVGALAEGAEPELDIDLLQQLDLTTEDLAGTIAAERAELARRLDHYRGGRPAPDVLGRTVVVVDDGLATGSTARAALRALRRRGARRLVLAVPVAAPESVVRLRDEADDIVAVLTPPHFVAVGRWYDDFTQTADEVVVELLAAGDASVMTHGPLREQVTVPSSGGALAGELVVPPSAAGVVVFAHGSGSSRHSSRNRRVAERLQDAGLATLLFDLLTAAEEAADAATGHLRFDIELLSERVTAAVDWLHRQAATSALPVGLFGASTGGAAALVAATRRPGVVAAVVSRGGRPDLAGGALAQVTAPTLLLVGERDEQVLAWNRQAAAQLHADHELRIVAGAGHLFEEPGALDVVASAAVAWFGARL